MQTQNVQATAILQLNKDNEALQKQITTLKMENERIQKAASEAIDLKTKYDKLHQQHHALTHEMKKKNEEITKLQNRISELEEKTNELTNYETLKQNSIDLQLRNSNLMDDLEQFQKTQIFSTKVNVIQDQKFFTQVRLNWNRNIQNLQLSYKVENDLLILDGFGVMNDKKVVYQQQIELPKRVKREQDRPQVSIKNSSMVLVFEN